MARPTIFARAASGLEAIARRLRGPEVSKIADIPGIPHYNTATPDQKTLEALRQWGVYSSRVSPLAGPSRTRFSIWPADGLTPEMIVTAQREAVASGIPYRWVEMIDQVYSRDGHYSSVTDQRVEDCIKGTWRLTRAAPDPAGTAMRNFADEVYRQCSRWRDGLGWLLYSNLYGYTAAEVEWQEIAITFAGPRGETIGPVEVAIPRKLYPVHPKHFRFDIESDDPMFWIGNTYQPLPLGKFIFMDGCGLHPTTVRRGHAWQCIWYSLFRAAGWSAWGVHVDRFSLPQPIIEYEGGLAQYQEYKDAYEDILNALGQGKGAVMPREGATLRIEDPPQGGRAGDPASALSDACDAGQSIRVLGATLTAKIGNVGSFAASETHADVKYSKEENDVGRMWERVDEQLTTPMITFNAYQLADALRAKGYDVTPELLMRRVPRGKHRVPRESDPMTEAQTADIYVNRLNLPLSIEGMLDRVDFPRALDDEDRVRGEAQAVAKGGALMTTADAAKPGGEANPDEAAETTAKANAASAAHAIASAQADDDDDDDDDELPDDGK